MYTLVLRSPQLRVNKLEIVTKDIFKLFDSQIQPSLLYASEVWGLVVTDDHVEKVHTYACKRFLNVSLRTLNNFVYGELGRFFSRSNLLYSGNTITVNIVENGQLKTTVPSL